ncbi:hypothetical protein [Georgenia ruanii]|uniref:hypothetical protein n=1 Tax=Georgenia ruanii TaxID=348442 RepID=UPI00186B19A3|nr:hypothetical protein [Georgenia ruanii]
MYGSDMSSAAALAATGLAVGYQSLALGVLVLAGVAGLTAARVLARRLLGEPR